MKYLLLLILTGCAYNTKLTPVVFPNEYNVYNVTGKCTDVKRLYITHGFGGDKSVYDNYPFNVFFKNITDKCYQIISYDLPHGDFNEHFRNQGLNYRVSFTEYLLKLKSEVDSKYGSVGYNVVGGVSFGGFHALMSVELTDIFDAYFALKPVTDYTALVELANADSTQFNPFNDSLQLNKIPGLIIYGTRDERVNYRLTERLKSTVTARFISLDEGHESNDANLLLISDWLK